MKRILRIVLCLFVTGGIFALPAEAECWNCYVAGPYQCSCIPGGNNGAVDCYISVATGCCVLTGNCRPQSPGGITAAGTLVTSSPFIMPMAAQNIWPTKPLVAWEPLPRMVATTWRADCRGRIIARWMTPMAASMLRSGLSEIHV